MFKRGDPRAHNARFPTLFIFSSSVASCLEVNTAALKVALARIPFLSHLTPEKILFVRACGGVRGASKKDAGGKERRGWGRKSTVYGSQGYERRRICTIARTRESVSPNVTQEERRKKQREREKDTNFFSPPLIAVPMTATEKKKIEKFSSRLSIFLASVFLMDRWEAISIGIDRRCSDLVPFGPGLSGCKQSKGIFIDVVLCPSLILLSPHFESSSFNSLTRFKFLLFGLIFGRGEIFQSTRNRVQG